MAFDGLLITEIFHSLQGETTHVGIPYVFVRLTGCNLRCTYCDTSYAFKGGERRTIDSVFEEVKAFNCKYVLITGGEPLLQRNTLELVKRLKNKGFLVSIETHGEFPIEPYTDYARIILDIKTPGSKMNRGGYIENIQKLKAHDEIKFVITSPSDYEWSKELVRTHNLADICTVLFSPVLHNKASPEAMEDFNLEWLANRILKDHLPVRMQFQLHKLIWGAERRGV